MKATLGAGALALASANGISASKADRPNVLFICVDDLNHWIGYTGRNPQTKTPNIDRLSAMGVSFTNAHCAAPACGPTRASLWSGYRPATSGCYHNQDSWRKHIPKGVCLNYTFKQAGYHTAAMGKTYHTSTGGKKTVYGEEWSYYPPCPKSPTAGAGKFEGYFTPRKKSIKNEEIGDWHTVDFCIKQMNTKRDKPLFLACGLSKPHLPWDVPDKYHEMFPLKDIKLPPYLENDLDDVPPIGRKIGNPQDHPKMIKTKMWKTAIQSYLATVAWCDMNIGRLLDALAKSPIADNTIIVLWGDHGWHLGEKDHWRKFTLWEEATRAPLIWVAPGVTKTNAICTRPVDFMTIYPTLCDLTGLKTPDHVEGKSIRALLENPKAEYDGVALTTEGFKNHAVRDDRWRYIRYRDGSEELYDHDNDPYEHTNLAKNPKFNDVKKRLAKFMPTDDVKIDTAPLNPDWKSTGGGHGDKKKGGNNKSDKKKGDKKKNDKKKEAENTAGKKKGGKKKGNKKTPATPE
ncbi:MAG: sulfatase [Phycisphaerales bacterium]|nr:sulfatase [Phycisphaerales bacterium]